MPPARLPLALVALLATACLDDFSVFDTGARSGGAHGGDAGSSGLDGSVGDSGGPGAGGASSAGGGAGASAGAMASGGRSASGGARASGGAGAAGGESIDGGTGGTPAGGAGGAGAGGRQIGGAGGTQTGGAGGTQAGGAGGTQTGGAGGARAGGAAGMAGSGGQPTCTQRYGSLPGFLLCMETPQNCRFVQATAAAQTCTAVCASVGGTCSQADNGDPGSCTVTNVMVGCAASLASSICVCSR